MVKTSSPQFKLSDLLDHFTNDFKQKNLTVYTMRFKSNKKLASTYSPGFDPSTIGGAGLNCSVRNGKRCSPALLTP